MKLGDAIAKVTHAVGIEPCESCKERQKKLNEFSDKISDLMKSMVAYLDRKEDSSSVSNKEEDSSRIPDIVPSKYTKVVQPYTGTKKWRR